VVTIGLVLALISTAQAWQGFLDGSALPGPPWDPFINEGSTTVVDIGGGNFALRMDSPDHTAEDPDPAPGTYYNEYYDIRFGEEIVVGAARFRLLEFSPTGKENLLCVTVGAPNPIAPSITLVDGNYWVWSYTSQEPILDLGPADNDWHTAYIMANRLTGLAKVWWDGTFVIDGPVTDSPNLDGYVEFGSGVYWETDAHTVVDFDWVGSGDRSDFIPEPGTISLTVMGGLGLLWAFRRRQAR
jgi:hypothetical protein